MRVLFRSNVIGATWLGLEYSGGTDWLGCFSAAVFKKRATQRV
ncbi:hypothetical protein [Xylella taiwanensis]|nr:hypothetical protein [Xylella taiwanensis]